MVNLRTDFMKIIRILGFLKKKIVFSESFEALTCLKVFFCVCRSFDAKFSKFQNFYGRLIFILLFDVIETFDMNVLKINKY